MRSSLNPIVLRKAKIIGNFGVSEFDRVKGKNYLEQLLNPFENGCKDKSGRDAAPVCSLNPLYTG